MDYKKYTAEMIEKASGLDYERVYGLLEAPPEEKMGDLAFPCFSLARTMKKAPPLIANEIKDKLETGDVFEKVEVAGGYLNFYYNKQNFVKDVIANVLEKGEDYGKSGLGSGKTVVVEFSSPNIAKPFHIGHMFATAVGNAINNIYRFLGYNTVKINHLGDWGTQFGKLISAYKRWGNKEIIDADPINELLKIYVKFHEMAEEDPSLDPEARMYFKKLEDNDPETVELWKYFRDVSLKEFDKTYEMLGVTFDSNAGESFYIDKIPAVVDSLKEKKLLRESDGAYVVNLDDIGIPPCIVIKSDGATIYAARDLAAAIYRKNEYNFYKNIYVVGMTQALHFKQVFSVLEKMGYEWAKDCVHVGFGLVKFPDKKLSTRHGDVVILDDVLEESIAKTREIIVENNNVEDVDLVSKKIGVGAVIFSFLKNNRERDSVFTWEDMLDFEGESAPYVQYSYARGKSVLRKAAEQNIDYSSGKPELLTDPEEFKLVKLIDMLDTKVKEAADKYEPSVVTRYAIDLAQQFNKFYNSCPVLKAEDELKKARLMLVEASANCIKIALNLIGVDVVERM